MKLQIFALLFWASSAFAGQGIYLEAHTIDEDTAPVAYVSGNTTPVTLTIQKYESLSPPAAHYTDATVVGTEQTDGATPWVDAEWTRSETLPAQDPGMYLVAIDAADVTPSTIDFGGVVDTYQTMLMVVPTAPTADLLLVVPTLTAHCYSEYGGKSCYTSGPVNEDIGYARPGILMEYVDRMVRVTARLDTLGITWDVIGQEYIAANPNFLHNYRSLVFVDQMEYVTFETRNAVEGYLDCGGRLLIFGSETWIYMVRNESGVYKVHKNATRSVDPYATDGDPGNDHLVAYHASGEKPDRPESAVTGVSAWLGYNPSVAAWTAHRTNHWLYDSTSLSDGDTFRDGSDEPALLLTNIVDGVTSYTIGGQPWVLDGPSHNIPTTTMILASVATSNARPPFSCGEVFESDTGCRVVGTGAFTITELPGGGIVMALPDKHFPSYIPTYTIPTQMFDNAVTKFAGEAAIDVFDGYKPRMGTVVISGAR